MDRKRTQAEFTKVMSGACDPAQFRITRGIRAVSFDVGGTLIDPWPSVGHIYADVARKHGIRDVSPEELTRRFTQAWSARRKFEYTRQDWAEIVDKTFDGLTPEPPSRTFFDELWARFDHPDAWQIYEDVLPTINALASHGLKLAIISNWDERLRPLLDRLGLSRHFDQIIISIEVGAHKPDRKIFELAAARLELAPSTILHVGDSPEEDFIGARAAGFHSLLLARSSSVQAQPHVIRRLSEICEILGCSY
ncbi:MAG: HAD-IA family hydrolase [Verrucomicrobiae bacterium]|nr:HAD-IA family hydrolase [Verrucomicrobiae bacterium]